jgi:hypothetical protein
MDPLWLVVAGAGVVIALPLTAYEMFQRRRRRQEKARSFRRKEKIRLVRAEAAAASEDKG